MKRSRSKDLVIGVFIIIIRYNDYIPFFRTLFLIPCTEFFHIYVIFLSGYLDTAKIPHSGDNIYTNRCVLYQVMGLLYKM